jgi:succinate--hydroxymethylglutarate CoA-transferase
MEGKDRRTTQIIPNEKIGSRYSFRIAHSWNLHEQDEND